jgi:heptosyltransferase-1
MAGAACHRLKAPAADPNSQSSTASTLRPPKDWRHQAAEFLKTTHEIKALRDRLKAVPYNAVIDLQGWTTISGFRAACPVVNGLLARSQPTRRRQHGFSFTERVRHPRRARNRAGSGTGLGRSRRCAHRLTPPILPIDPAAEAWCDAFLASSGTRPHALINPGAGWGAKQWPVERYAAVARGLMERGFRVLVNAGPSEEQLADVIVKGTSGAAIPLSVSLDQLIALMRRIALCVAGDTGPLHLACALGRRVVGIYGPTDPSRNGPFGTRFKVLRSPLSRRDHTRHPEPEAGLLTIQPEDVLLAAGELLVEETA